MLNLFNAIKERWDEAFEEVELYNTEAPEGVEYPYATIAILAGAPDWTFTENYEDMIFQFNVYSSDTTCEEVGNIFETIKGAFDFYDLGIESAEVISLVRNTAGLTRVDDKWQLNIVYDIKFQND